MNSLRTSRSSQLYFTSFLLLGLWFLLPLLLAGIYTSYHREATEAEARFAKERETGLKQAFQLLKQRRGRKRSVHAAQRADDGTTVGAFTESVAEKHHKHDELSNSHSESDPQLRFLSREEHEGSTAVQHRREAEEKDAGIRSPPTVDSEASCELPLRPVPQQTLGEVPPTRAESDIKPVFSSHLHFVAFGTCIRLLTSLWDADLPSSSIGQSQLNPMWNRARLYFLQLDRDQSGKLNEYEFQKLCHVLTNDNELRSELSRQRNILPPTLSIWRAPWMIRLSKIMQSKWRRHVTLVLLLVHTSIAAAQSIEWVKQQDASVNGVYCLTSTVPIIADGVALQLVDLMFLAFFVIEICCDLLTSGFFPFFWHRHAGHLHVFHAAWTAAMLIVETALWMSIDAVACVPSAQPVILLLRVLRVTRITLLERHISAIVSTYLRLVPQFAGLVALLFALLVGYTRIGLLLFGGRHLVRPARGRHKSLLRPGELLYSEFQRLWQWDIHTF